MKFFRRKPAPEIKKPKPVPFAKRASLPAEPDRTPQRRVDTSQAQRPGATGHEEKEREVESGIPDEVNIEGLLGQGSRAQPELELTKQDSELELDDIKGAVDKIPSEPEPLKPMDPSIIPDPKPLKPLPTDLKIDISLDELDLAGDSYSPARPESSAGDAQSPEPHDSARSAQSPEPHDSARSAQSARPESSAAEQDSDHRGRASKKVIDISSAGKEQVYSEASERERRQQIRQARRLEREERARLEREKKMKSDKRRERRRARREAKNLERERRREEKLKSLAENLAHSPEQQTHHWSHGLPLLEKIFAPTEAEAAPRRKKQALSSRIRNWQSRRAHRAWDDIVGLDIGSSAIRASYISEQGIIMRERAIPEGIISRGILEEPEELSEELRDFWLWAELPSKNVNFSLGNRLVVMRTLRLPAENESDIEQAIALNAAPIVAPMDPKKSCIDYNELSRSGPYISLQVAAAEEEMSDNFTRAIEGAGLVPLSCELGALAGGRSIIIPRDISSSHGIIDIGAEKTTVAFASGPDIFFLRILDIGGNDFTSEISRSAQISWEEAERLKREIGMGPSRDTPAGYRRALQSVADRISQEILQTKELYAASALGEERPPEGITLLGGGSRLQGLPEQIEFLAALPLSPKTRPWPGLEEVSDLDLWNVSLGLARENKMSLLDASGIKPLVAPRKTSKISSQEADQRAKELTPRKKSALVRGKVLFLLLLPAIFLGAFVWGNKISNENTATRSEISALAQNIKASRQAQGRGLLSLYREQALSYPDWKKLPALESRIRDFGGRIVSTNTRADKQEIIISGMTPQEIERASRGIGLDVSLRQSSLGIVLEVGRGS